MKFEQQTLATFSRNCLAALGEMFAEFVESIWQHGLHSNKMADLQQLQRACLENESIDISEFITINSEEVCAMEFDERLILAVREYSILWDMKRSDYKNNAKKHAAWNSIANAVQKPASHRPSKASFIKHHITPEITSLDARKIRSDRFAHARMSLGSNAQTVDAPLMSTLMPVKDCRLRWRQLRDRYTRDLRRKKNQRELGIDDNDDDDNKVWVYSEQMEFIQAQIKPRRSNMIDKPRPTLSSAISPCPSSSSVLSPTPSTSSDRCLSPSASKETATHFNSPDANRSRPPKRKTASSVEKDTALCEALNSTTKSLQNFSSLIKSHFETFTQTVNTPDPQHARQDAICTLIRERYVTLPDHKKNMFDIRVLSLLMEIENE